MATTITRSTGPRAVVRRENGARVLVQAGENTAQAQAILAAIQALGLQSVSDADFLARIETNPEGLTLLGFLNDGGQYATKMYRPGPLLGIADKVDVWAELAALANINIPSANAAAIRNAVRNYGFMRRAATMLDADDTPTATLGSGGAVSAINGNGYTAPNVPRTSSKLTYCTGPLALAGANFPASSYFTNRGAYAGRNSGDTADIRATQYFSYEFDFAGDDIEFQFRGGGGSGVNVRVLCDEVICATASVPSGTGLGYYWRLEFPTSRTRRLRVETYGVPCNGVNVADPDEVTSTGRIFPVATQLYDSFGEGTQADNGDMQSAVMMRALGLRACLTPVGSTGLLAPGGSNTGGGSKVPYHDATRLQDYTLDGVTDALTGTAIAPDIGFLFGSINDQSLSSSVWNTYGSTIEEAAANRVIHCCEAFAEANPGVMQIVGGPLTTNGPPIDPPADLLKMRDGMQIGAWAMAKYNVHFFDRMTPPKRYGDKTVSTTDAYRKTGVDGVHPGSNGHPFDGLDDAARVKPIIMTAS